MLVNISQEITPSVAFVVMTSFDSFSFSFASLRNASEFSNDHDHVNSNNNAINDSDNNKRELWKLRELVGSIHKISTKLFPKILIIINDQNVDGDIHEQFGSYLEEMTIWKGVEVLSLSSLLTGINKKSKRKWLFKMETIKPLIINHFLNVYKMVIMMNVDCQFSSLSGYLKLINKTMESGHVKTDKCINSFYGKKALISQYRNHLFCIMKRLRENCSDPILIDTHREEEFDIGSILAKPLIGKNGGYNYCHLQLGLLPMLLPRLSFSFSSLSNTNANPNANAIMTEIPMIMKKTKICFGIPVKGNDKIPMSDQCFFKFFLPTLLNSISNEEYQHFDYTIYLGYDNGDSIYDDSNNNHNDKLFRLFQSILSSAGRDRTNNNNSSIQLSLHRLPTTHWLTYIWNYLFVQSILDGCDYFYQAGDDVEFKTKGWSTFFTSTLQSFGNIGVVGPNDKMWKCSLLTQSMVHAQTHWSIFGYFYPLEIRDWFSDNWMTLVYGKRRKCFMNIKITNDRSNRRYSQCDKPPWKEALRIGQEKVTLYLQNKTEK